jgi:Fe-S cluster biogenesis protein NfuA
MEAADTTAVRERIAGIEKAIAAVQASADPALRATVRDLVEALLELHGSGIERMLEISFEAERGGSSLIDTIAADELAGGLLLLHGLHPLDLRARVLEALRSVRPHLASHGGDVELLDVAPDGGIVIRLLGSCNGCSASALTLKGAVEEAIGRIAPDVTSITVEGAVDDASTGHPAPAGFVPLAQVGLM